MSLKNLDEIIEAALEEDMPEGDVTSESLIDPDSVSEAFLVAKEKGVLAGIEIAEWVFQKIDPNVKFEALKQDGDDFENQDRLGQIKGPSRSLLNGERLALNFIQRLSGIATLTKKYTDILKQTKTKLLDTRKTTPCMRMLEKYAVRMGGGVNHRLNLSEMILIKDNHLHLVGSIKEAIQRARKAVGEKIKIEVETTSLDEVKEALKYGADIIMLDNMSPEDISRAVKAVDGRVPLEVSGNITLSKLKEVAELGVDFISAGSLTHSFRSLDISMDFK
ncbi:MAG: carboxylating nicotinate-nucleotide diphosphorylase [Candidatus Aminicenantes bacterium]|nr:carboxylating nicotinate-nucleotide diphosphorylase [Candidatus Aminicenantes bacterium]